MEALATIELHLSYVRLTVDEQDFVNPLTIIEIRLESF
jgi:hypothetical protein